MGLDRDKYRQNCKHFNGTMNKMCAAGVCYTELAGTQETGWGLRLPCLGDFTERARQQRVEQAVCDKREPYTEADIDARETQIEASMERHRRAAPLCAAIRKANKGRSATGSDPCPACGTGTLHWRISGYNGHMHGRCTTSGCLNWME